MMDMNVVVRGKWRPVELEPSLFLKEDMSHLICIEELTDYDVVDRNTIEVCCEILNSLLSLTRPKLSLCRNRFFLSHAALERETY